MFIVTFRTKVKQDDWQGGRRDVFYDECKIFPTQQLLESWIKGCYDSYMADKRSVKIYHLGKEVQVTKQITYKYE